MGVLYELVWTGNDGVERSKPVIGPVTVGRGLRNDLVIESDRISWQHARLWTENGVLFVADAGSTNGTYVNDGQVLGSTRLAEGDKLRLGGEVALEIRTSEGATSALGALFVLEDMTSGMRYPIDGRFVIAPSGEADLRVHGAEKNSFAVRDEAVFLLINGHERALRAGELIVVGDLSLRLVSRIRQQHVRTVRPTWDEGHYHIESTLEGRTPFARVSDDEGNSLEVDGETRATLLYVLARQALRDRAEGVQLGQEGWLDDSDAVTHVWGRTNAGDVSNRLSVVVYRLRSDLKKAGLDAGFVERERGRIRIKAARVSLG